jgi:hypothetical protein
MKKAMLLALAAMSVAAAPAAGQTISQGMTSDQVRAEVGAPATSRAAGEWTYWYYHNGCPVRCGSDDVVFFQNDRVVAAVLRTARRRYAGPRADDALQATDDGTSAVRVDAASDDGPARVGGVIVVPAPADAGGEPVQGTPVPAREGRPGEPSTIIMDATGASIVAPAPATPVRTNADAPAPAENTEATDTRGQTSIDRKNQRVRRDRANEPSATERARQNDRRRNP